MSQQDVDEQQARAEAHGNGSGGGVSVEAIDAYPTAANFHNGDRLIVSKGVEPATLTGTCSGVSSNPNATIIGDASISVDSGLNAVAFAAAIVAGLNNPTALQQMKASSIDDNGDGTFEVDFYPGVFGNSVVASGSDNNPSFAVTYPGSSELQQVDESTVIEKVLDAVADVDLFDGLPAQTPPLTDASLFMVSVPTPGFAITGTGIVDGTYLPADVYNSKQRCNLAGHEATLVNAAYWNSVLSIWVITNIDAVVQYYSTDDVATADLVTTWVNVSTITGSGSATVNNNTTYDFAGFDAGLPLYQSALVAEIRFGGGHNGHNYWHVRRKGVAQYYYFSDNVTDPVNAVWTIDTNGTVGAVPTFTHASNLLPTIALLPSVTKTIKSSELSEQVLSQAPSVQAQFAIDSSLQATDTEVSIFADPFTLESGKLYLVEGAFYLSIDVSGTVTLGNNGTTFTSEAARLLVEVIDPTTDTTDTSLQGGIVGAVSTTYVSMIRFKGFYKVNAGGVLIPTFRTGSPSATATLDSGSWMSLQQVP